VTEPVDDPSVPPDIFLQFDRENVKALYKLLTELATFFDWAGEGTVADEAEEHFGIPDAAGWLAETLTDHADRIDQSFKAAEQQERRRWQF